MMEKCSTYPWSHDKYCSKHHESGIDTSRKVYHWSSDVGQEEGAHHKSSWLEALIPGSSSSLWPTDHPVHPVILLGQVHTQGQPVWCASPSLQDRVWVSGHATALMTNCWGIGKGHLFRDNCTEVFSLLWKQALELPCSPLLHWLLPAALQ